MRGHVRKRGSTWSVFYDRPRGPDGRRRKTSKGGFRTKKEAERWLASLVSTLDRGEYVEPSRQTLGAFLEEWLPVVETRQLRTSTRLNYRYLIERHVVPRLGGVPLQKLTPAMLNAVYAELLTSGRCNGRGGLSPKSVREIHTVLRRALQDAVRWNRLPRNVADAADPPRKSASQKEMRTWSKEQLAAFLRSVQDDRLYAAWHVSAMTGARRGEVLGLRWQDVDLAAGRLSIVQTMLSPLWQPEVGEPKTARGRRNIALDPGTVAVLREHRDRQELERLALGLDPRGELVFTQPTGEPVHPRSFSKLFTQRVKEAKLPAIRLHDLRHTHATLALEAGIHPKVVSERLGHSSVSITLDRYSHAIPAMEETAAALVAALVLGEEAPPGASVLLPEPAE